MIFNIFVLSVVLHVVLNGRTALCMTVKTVSGGLSSIKLAGYNSTSTASATQPYQYLSTGIRAATQTRPGANAGTATTSDVGFGSGPCPTEATDYPPFIMPTRNPTESCDIYGPLCQTGSIAVGVGTANHATTTTTVPCSCYLTAQSLTVEPTAPSWHTGYGRSPQCFSLLQVFDRPSLAANAPIFSSCPGDHNAVAPDFGIAGRRTLNDTLPALPNLVQDPDQVMGSCCGYCDVRIPRVQIFFFPGSHESKCANTNASAKQSTTGPSITPAPHPSFVHRALYPRGNASVAVSNGFTYTYPSIYMEIGQSFSMTDNCGIMGKVYSSTVLAFAPGSLSTVSYDIPVGAEFGPHLTGSVPYGHTKTLDPDDLACPTWGLSKNYNPDNSAFPYLAPGDAGIEISPDGKPSEVEAGDGVTIGSPFYPVIVVPTAILSLDPAWGRCSSILNQFIPIFDPPRTLTVDDIMAAPAGPPIDPPTPTPQAEMVPSSSTSPPSRPAAVGNPGVQTGLVQEQPDPTNTDVEDAGLPATAVPPAPTPPAKVPAAAVESNDPKAAAAESQPSSVTPVQNPPTNVPTAQKDQILASQLNAALAVSESQAASPVLTIPSNNIINTPAPKEPPAKQDPGIPSPANVINVPSSQTVAATVDAGASPAANPIVQDSEPHSSEAPAPAFAGVINAPSGNAGPPITSSEPGLGGQILKPFLPVTTAQSTIEVASIPPYNAKAGPSTNAQVAQNLPSNDNSPQQQQPTPPSNINDPPASVADTAQSPPAKSNAPSQLDNSQSKTQDNHSPPPYDQLASNPPQGGPSPPPQSQESSPETNPPQGQPSYLPQQQQPSQAVVPPAITINSQTYTRNSVSAYVIASQTLIPGAEVTINNPNSNDNFESVSAGANGAASESQSGTAAPTSAPALLHVSLASDGSIAIVGSSTQDIILNTPVASPAPIPPSSPSLSDSPPPPPPSSPSLATDSVSAFIINSHPFILQPTPATAIVTGAESTVGQESGAVTLTAVGQTVTIASAPVALASSGGSVMLVEGSGSGASVVAVASGTRSEVVIEPAPSGSAGASVVEAGKNGALGMRSVGEGKWVWVVMGVVTSILL